MKVMEIGANKGVTTVAIARKVGPNGRVYAFEPVPEYYASLKKNLSLNGVENVKTYRLAVGNRSGQVKFYKHGGGSGIIPQGQAEKFLVKTITVDAFLDLDSEGVKKIDLINMDCEGSELLVLRGAQKTLRANHPRVFCEIH